MRFISISVRPPAVAGTVLSGRRRRARGRDVGGLLAQAEPAARGKPVPKAIIAPHAGYIYSGAVAAAVYARLAPAARHASSASSCWARCIACRCADWRCPRRSLLATPLGNVWSIAKAHAALSLLPQVGVSAAAHAQEHSLEVQLPFLQTVLANFTVVPLAVGDASAEEVAQVHRPLWGGRGNADRREFRPFALSVVTATRRRSTATPRRRSSICAATFSTSRPAAARRSTASRSRRGATASRPNWSICAIPATPPATATASSATAHSSFTRIEMSTDIGALAMAQMTRDAARLHSAADAGSVLLPLARGAIAARTEAAARSAAADAPWLRRPPARRSSR